MTGKTAALENVIGHKFRETKLLERALTHRSWAYENNPNLSDEKIREIENESIEFLGDSVLGLIVAELLFAAHPRANEGDLTLMKHNLVSTKTLASVAQDLKLGDFFRVGKGEEKTGGRKKQALLANTLEAVIGAIFLDGGYSAARVFISRIFAERMKEATPRNSVDYKTMVQEKLQAQKRSAPTYTVLKTDGPPHARTFFVEAAWEHGKSRGSGNSRKAAEMMAAEEALKQIDPDFDKVSEQRSMK